MYLQILIRLGAGLIFAACTLAPATAASSRVTVPLGAIAGLRDAGPADGKLALRLAFELQPHGDLDTLAAQASDPTNPAHRRPLTLDAFTARFGRMPETRAFVEYLRRNGASNLYFSRTGLMVGAILDLAHTQTLFHVTFHKYTDGERVVTAPTGPLTIPVDRIRDVRGAVLATTPRLNDIRAPYTGFRGNWYAADEFRTMYDALPGGGDGQRIALVEDASDSFDTRDVSLFLRADGAPEGAEMSRITEQRFAFKTPSMDCGRDDRGQEAALDVDAAVTMAPLAQIMVTYDDVCSLGNDGTVPLQRALDGDPTVVVFPFAVGPVRGSVASRYGLTPLPLLQAAVMGIPVVTSAGDDGAYGYREKGIEQAAVTWPCVSAYVICAGGTQLGDRLGTTDEAPWNDAAYATGGGISNEPRPAWQDAPAAYELSSKFIKTRTVPDVSADAAGHLLVFWHGYGLGGVGGTSESASLVGAQLAAINAAVPAQHRLVSAGDLYALARSAPGAFRSIANENDRRYLDNTLRPRASPPPKGYRGLVAPTPTPIYGCNPAQAEGCSVKQGYNAVTGIGSLKERAAADALR